MSEMVVEQDLTGSLDTSGIPGLLELGLAGWIDQVFLIGSLAWICFVLWRLWVFRKDWNVVDLAWVLPMLAIPGYLIWVLLDIWWL